MDQNQMNETMPDILGMPPEPFFVTELRRGNGTFGDAILALKAGHKVARSGWNGKGMFLILNGGYAVEKEKSRPDNHINEAFLENEGQTHLHIGQHIDMWTAQKNLCVGWLASQTDMLSEDWCIVE